MREFLEELADLMEKHGVTINLDDDDLDIQVQFYISKYNHIEIWAPLHHWTVRDQGRRT